MKRFGPGLLSVMFLALAVLPLAGCGGDSETPADTEPETAVPLSSSKIHFPVRADLVLMNEPEPGKPADIKLLLENTLPEGCTVEIELVLPGNAPLEKGRARQTRRLAARGRAEMAWRVRIPDAGRHVIAAKIHLPNPEGLPATGGATLVIGPGTPEKAGKEPVSVTTSDGRKLSVTVPE
jgi:hypothetical protein